MKSAYYQFFVALLLGGVVSAAADSDIYVKPGTALPPSLEADWQLVFSDEFRDSSLDTTKWNRISYENWQPNSKQWLYYQSQEEHLVSVNENNNGCVKLRADYGNYYNQEKYQNNGYKVVNNESTNYNTYACGGIDTRNTFTFKYGYVEVRASFTHINGAWPAIWMMPKGGGSWPSSGEIDIMEHVAWQTTVYQTLHHLGANGAADSTTVTPQPSINDQYGGSDMHIYGMKWTEDYIEFYVDGERTGIMFAANFAQDGRVWPFGDDGCEFYLIMDQQITTVTSWQTGNMAVDEAALQAAMEADQAYMTVDYVRIYSTADYMHSVPEPATATLSLLALAGLASRRRRS